MASSQLRDLGHQRAVEEVQTFSRRADAAHWRAAWRARDRWESRWARALEGFFSATDRQAFAHVEDLSQLVTKAYPPEPPPENPLEPSPGAVAAAAPIVEALRGGLDERQFESGALAIYLGLAVDMAEDAGQFTLDGLGLNSTFAWAGQRDFVRDQLAVRGSKIIQQAYGTHLEELARMIIRATDPAHPKTIGEVTREIRDEWPRLTKAQAERIARTETAIIWDRTQWYAMRANGVRKVLWLIATGPAIGTRVADVCERCLLKKASSPYLMDELDEIPPLHPNCRCTLAPVLSPTWLPPKEPWTGSQWPPDLFGDVAAPAQKAAQGVAFGGFGVLAKGVGWDAMKHPHAFHGHWANTGTAHALVGGLPTHPFQEPPPPRPVHAGNRAGGFAANGETATRVGDLGEAIMRHGLGLDFGRTKWQGPIDAVSAEHAFEIKTVTVHKKEYRVGMKTREIEEKLAAAREMGLKPALMVVVLDPENGRAHAYWREGIANGALNESFFYIGEFEAAAHAEAA